MDTWPLGMRWEPDRPRILVAACSDGRLQEATDAFLTRALGVRQYDRLYLPGGGGALAASGSDFLRAEKVRQECRFLIEAHDVEHLILLFHGPAPGGPSEAACDDYRRKHSWQRPVQVRAQQDADVRDLLGRRSAFAGEAQLSVYRFEVTAGSVIEVVPLHVDTVEQARGRERSRARKPDRGDTPSNAFPT